MSDGRISAAAERLAQEFAKIGGSSQRTESGSEDGRFGKLLTDLMKETDDLQHTADAQVFDLAAGKTENVHEVLLAMAKADMSFKMMLEVRNKLLDAYQEVMRMQV